MTKRLFIFGYGYTAKALVDRLRQEGGWLVAGTTRSKEKADAMHADGVEPVIWDGGALREGALHEAAYILISTPPTEEGCPAFNAAAPAIAAARSRLQWLSYLSTNGVYGDHSGNWVDETSELRATSPRALRRVKAEDDWASLALRHHLPLIRFRLPGIYGSGRSAIETVRERSAKRIYKEGQVFSRMHVEDIAAALAASMARPRAHDLYNLADDLPAPPQDVVEYACRLVGAAVPPLVPLEEADLSDMAKSFYADNKRVSNRRMKEALGVTLRYPTYREGLDAIAATIAG